MFPRGYFSKIGRFIFWLLLLAGVILSLLQMIFRAGDTGDNGTKDDGANREEDVPYDVREAALWMCDCTDVSSHVDETYHSYDCEYRRWVNKKRKGDNS